MTADAYPYLEHDTWTRSYNWYVKKKNWESLIEMQVMKNVAISSLCNIVSKKYSVREKAAMCESYRKDKKKNHD